jgi:hypothetical protein
MRMCKHAKVPKFLRTWPRGGPYCRAWSPCGGGGDIQRSEIEFEYFRNIWSLNQKELLGVNPGNQVGSWIYLMKKTRSQKYHDTVPIRGKHVYVCWYACIFVSASYRELPAYATKPDTGTEYTGNFRVNLHGNFWSWFFACIKPKWCQDYVFLNWLWFFKLAVPHIVSIGTVSFRNFSVRVKFHPTCYQYAYTTVSLCKLSI